MNPQGRESGKRTASSPALPQPNGPSAPTQVVNAALRTFYHGLPNLLRFGVVLNRCKDLRFHLGLRHYLHIITSFLQQYPPIVNQGLLEGDYRPDGPESAT